MRPRRDEKGPWQIEDVFPQLEQFIRTARIITARSCNKIWVRVFPGIAFCADHSRRKLHPPSTCLLRPLRPEQVWAAFLALSGQEGLREQLEFLKPRPGPLTASDLIGDDYLLDDPELLVFVTHGDLCAEAEAAVLRYLSTALRELNEQIVDALDVESWVREAEALFQDLRLDTSLMSRRERDQLISIIADHWDLVAPYLPDTSSGAHTSGPATLYLIALCSACAADIEPESTASSRVKTPPWALAMLDDAEVSPHVRLKQAVLRTGMTPRVIRSARRLGSEAVRILAGNSRPGLAFEKCVRGLELAVEVGSGVDEAFLREVETAEPKWRRLPTRVIRRVVAHARAKRGTTDHEEILAMEISVVVDALEHAQFDLRSLPENVGWPRMVSIASYLEWNSSLAPYCDSGYEIRPLVNSTELKDESKAMYNCVKGYDLLCVGDIARVFSIRHLASRTRVATALLVREDKDMTWELDEVSGPHNHLAHPAIRAVASRIAEFYNQSEPKTSSFDRLGTMDKAAAKLTKMSTGGLLID